MSSDLKAFLEARLDEDEVRALKAREVWEDESELYEWNDLSDEAFAHARWHDPARVLREVEAKRAILNEHAPGYPVTYPEPSGQPTCGVCQAGGFDWDPHDWPCPTVRALAAVWNDHPDYRDEWKVKGE